MSKELAWSSFGRKKSWLLLMRFNYVYFSACIWGLFSCNRLQNLWSFKTLSVTIPQDQRLDTPGYVISKVFCSLVPIFILEKNLERASLFCLCARNRVFEKFSRDFWSVKMTLSSSLTAESSTRGTRVVTVEPSGFFFFVHTHTFETFQRRMFSLLDSLW